MKKLTSMMMCMCMDMAMPMFMMPHAQNPVVTSL